MGDDLQGRVMIAGLAFQGLDDVEPGAFQQVPDETGVGQPNS